MSKPLVFVGPSLPVVEAKKILPDAWYHKPIKCGDILRCMRLNPKTIVIIDGYFEQTASVWHKEILYAIESGITVFGASSMGALRAAELDAYGMIGVGELYQQFAQGEMDDDEVSFVHEAEFGGRIVPMCNIRATLKAALNAGQITQSAADTLIQTLKSKPYFERAFFELIDDCDCRQWCQTHFVDQKKRDAIACLTRVKAWANQVQQPTHQHSNTRTLYFHKLMREMIVSPFEHKYPWLPTSELAWLSHATQPYFAAMCRYAKLKHIESSLPDISATPNTNWVRYLGIYDDDTSQFSLHFHTKCAPILNTIAAYMNSLDFSFTAEKVQAFANRFRLRKKLLDAEKTRQWQTENALPEAKDFASFIHHMAMVYYLCDDHNSHILGLELICDTPSQWINHALAELTVESACQTPA